MRVKSLSRDALISRAPREPRAGGISLDTLPLPLGPLSLAHPPPRRWWHVRDFVKALCRGNRSKYFSARHRGLVKTRDIACECLGRGLRSRCSRSFVRSSGSEHRNARVPSLDPTKCPFRAFRALRLAENEGNRSGSPLVLSIYLSLSIALSVHSIVRH